MGCEEIPSKGVINAMDFSDHLIRKILERSATNRHCHVGDQRAEKNRASLKRILSSMRVPCQLKFHPGNKI